MKFLKLGKGEPAYISVPEGTQLSVQETSIVKSGNKLVLVRVV